MSETGNMMKASLLVSLLLLVASAAAQEANYLDVKTTVQKEELVTTDSGERQTRLVAADTVLPGDTVVYTITFTNVGGEAADDVVVTNPIDASLTYVDGSVFGAGMRIEFSADNGQTFAARDALTVVDNGAERTAAAADYTHIRWTMEGTLDVGSTGVARFSATVD